MAKLSQFCEGFSENGKTTKKQKETEIFVILKDFCVIFRYKNN
jgi:hypothetical protein